MAQAGAEQPGVPYGEVQDRPHARVAPESGDNVIAPFTDPVEVQEKDSKGNVVGIRYEYPQSKNQLLHDVQPLLEKAGVQLVYTGHSHLWNRFKVGR